MLRATVKAVHAVLVLRQTSEHCRATRRAATNGRVGVLEDEASLRQGIHVRSLTVWGAVNGRLESSIIEKNNHNVSLPLPKGDGRSYQQNCNQEFPRHRLGCGSLKDR